MPARHAPRVPHGNWIRLNALPRVGSRIRHPGPPDQEEYFKTMRFWLIQRCRAKQCNKGDIKSLDSVLRYDYMGAAEFEFGALAESAKAIRAAHDEYEWVKLDIIRNGEPMRLFARSHQIPEITEFIRDQQDPNPKVRLKEASRMIQVELGTKGSGLYPREPFDAWWDVENHWIACYGKILSKKIKLGIEAKL